MKKYHVIPARIALLRSEMGMKQTDFADQLSELLGKKFSPSVISMWETNRRSMPDKYVEPVAKFFGVSVAYLLGQTNDKTSEEPTILTMAAQETDKIEIPTEHLYKYDRRPVYVEFTGFEHENGWGLYDREKNAIVFVDFILKIKSKLPDNVRLYSNPPKYDINGLFDDYKPLDMIRIFYLDCVYIRMNTCDRAVQNLYNGWYHHNENHTALVNNEGNVLSYDGLNKWYTAYSTGDADPNDVLTKTKYEYGK